MLLHLCASLVDTEMIHEHNSGLRTGLNPKYICTCPQQARNMSLPLLLPNEEIHLLFKQLQL